MTLFQNRILIYLHKRATLFVRMQFFGRLFLVSFPEFIGWQNHTKRNVKTGVESVSLFNYIELYSITLMCFLFPLTVG